MEDLSPIIFIIISVISIAASIYNKKLKEAEKQKNHKPVEIDDIPSPKVLPKKNKRTKSTVTPTPTPPSPSIVEEAEAPKREYSEKEKMIIYSEIMKPKFDE